MDATTNGWASVYIDNPSLTCDFCGTTYSTVGRDDDWLNACEPCGAEGQAQLDLDEKLYPTIVGYGAETYVYSPDRKEV
jgi:hypothetical protein